ncbi:MAG: hypothetical protein IEMM0007_1430 [bacterium]|nr:MAG: hypothetical protein IEMM0007_1430 [bacterium]
MAETERITEKARTDSGIIEYPIEQNWKRGKIYTSYPGSESQYDIVEVQYKGPTRITYAVNAPAPVHIKLDEVSEQLCIIPHHTSTASKAYPSKNEYDIALICELYAIKNVLDVKSFLLENSHLISPLRDIYGEIRRIFTDKANSIILEKVIDPVENYSGLHIKIINDLSSDEALSLLDRFDEEWWLDVDFKIRRLLTIMA